MMERFRTSESNVLKSFLYENGKKVLVERIWLMHQNENFMKFIKKMNSISQITLNRNKTEVEFISAC